MLKTTLLPLSLKEPHQKLRNLTAFIIRLGTEKVLLCHIMQNESGKKRQEVTSALESIAEDMHGHGLKTDYVLGHGSIAHEVCRLVEQHKPDYITIPWKRKNVIKRTILSSPDIDILRICSYPTLIFKKSSFRDAGSKPDIVVYATDCKQTDEKVLPYLTSVPFKAHTLYFLHVRERAPDPVADDEHRRKVQEKMDQLAGKCRNRYKHIDTILVTGSIRSQISRNARKMNADLIIIGRNDKKKPMDKLLGSTAEAVPHKVYSSVLILT